MAWSATSIPAAFGMPPCAMSLLPPPRYCLRQQLQEAHVAVGERTDNDTPSAGFGSFGKQSGGLGCGQFFLRLLALLTQRPNLIERVASLLGHIVDMRREERGGLGERREIAACGGDGALSGDEFHAPSLANFFHLSQ